MHNDDDVIGRTPEELRDDGGTTEEPQSIHEEAKGQPYDKANPLANNNDAAPGTPVSNLGIPPRTVEIPETLNAEHPSTVSADPVDASTSLPPDASVPDAAFEDDPVEGDEEE